MTKYAAFLRGINVGNIRIKMTDLKLAFERVGGTNVVTYLQSGNVVFDSTEGIPVLKQNLEQELTQTFHYEAYVLLYLHETLAGVVAQYPFERDEYHHAYVLFVESAAVLEELKALTEGIGEERAYIAFGEQVIYWRASKGQSVDTPFSKILAKLKYKSTTTMRNINTLEKM
jgi:uncharacterized protein (DUF1697 family)